MVKTKKMPKTKVKKLPSSGKVRFPRLKSVTKRGGD